MPPPVCVRNLLQLFVPIKEQEVQPVLYSFSALFTVSLHIRRGSSSILVYCVQARHSQHHLPAMRMLCVVRCGCPCRS